ncbi:hypothetical protein CHN50_09915 [Priestia aryabhattai]|uniref:hypothetical protein n=1 Tax=Bacillaceae TaxID=186817 RepID=UPI000BA13DEE|nr:hypothetical protein [Bacillus sp. CBEL-1]MBY6023518.1 hypothetical protein [Nitratireductor sp. DP7N14-4]OZT12740.1 hypothetical protein CHN50_09915 [Priestia aryabhattai]TDB53801.1 hypothetical protein EPL02_05290 [Bacillus sp. CBEL-1]USY55529.1 hypothetical protein NIZ91_02265 [Bacillus sp. 1780r2a1]
MNTSSYSVYIQGIVKFGLAYGVVSLLSRWINSNTILSAPETLVKYGLLGGIGYAVMGAIALFLFGLIAPSIQKRFPNALTIGDILYERLDRRSYWFAMLVLVITSFDYLLIQVLSIGIIVHLLLKIPSYIGLLIFLLYCYVLFGLGGMKRIHKFKAIHISIVFAAIILIPVYFFIKEGIYPVYDGLTLYHPYLLYFKDTYILLFVLTGLIVSIGQLLIDRSTWQRIYVIEPSKIRSSFFMTGIIWSAIPLAFTSITLITIHNQGFEGVNSILNQLVEKVDSAFLIILFIGCCFSIIASTTGAELHATSIMIVRNILAVYFNWDSKQQLKKTYLAAGALCLALFFTSIALSPTLVSIIFFFGKIYAAAIPTMLVVIFYKKTVPKYLPYCSLAGGLFSNIPIYGVSNLTAIWISFGLSSFFIVCYLAINQIGKKPE